MTVHDNHNDEKLIYRSINPVGFSFKTKDGDDLEIVLTEIPSMNRINSNSRSQSFSDFGKSSDIKVYKLRSISWYDGALDITISGVLWWFSNIFRYGIEIDSCSNPMDLHFRGEWSLQRSSIWSDQHEFDNSHDHCL